MAEQKITIGEVNWRRSLPFTHLFRAFRVAIHPTKLMLAVAAILLMYMGGRALDTVWPSRYIDAGHIHRTHDVGAVFRNVAPPPFAALLHDQMGNVNAAVKGLVNLDMGFPSGMAASLLRFGVTTPVAFWQSNQVYFTLLFAWFVLVLALFGGAITRMAAVQVARDEQVAVRQALRFAWNKLPSFFGAPLIPLGLVLLVGVVMALIGLVLYIPGGVGALLVSLLLVVLLPLGVLLAMLMIGAVFGGGMMYPTIAVEASDAFDATSRAYSYVIGAPWRLLVYTIIATIYGAITFIFVELFVFLSLAGSRFFVAWWVADKAAERWNDVWPAPTLDAMGATPVWTSLGGAEPLAAATTCFWVYLFLSLIGAYAISFYFSSNTIIYYLLRHHVDATEMDDVFMQPEDEDAIDRAETEPTAAVPTPAAPVLPAAAAAPAEPPVTPPQQASATPPEKPAETDSGIGGYM